MRHEVNYKLITLAVGIAVAIAIVFTLWIEAPRTEVSGPNVRLAPQAHVVKTIIQTTSRLMKNTVSIITDRYGEMD